MSKKKHFFLIVLFTLLFTHVQSRVAAAELVQPTPHCHAIHVNPDDPQAFLPDPSCTPGVVNPQVTQENLATTICAKGFTKKIRPPSSYTTKLKKQQIIEYGYTNTDLKNYEEDHLISLELGGHPSDPRNLWPEPHPSMNKKDTIENYLRAQVCDGQMTLVEAQDIIAHRWYELYQKLHPPTVVDYMQLSLKKFSSWLKKVLHFP